MATEKLAEGIRQFARDQEKLRRCCRPSCDLNRRRMQKGRALVGSPFFMFVKRLLSNG